MPGGAEDERPEPVKPMTLFLPFSLALVCFFHRALFRILFPRIHGFDVHSHRFFIECTRLLKGRFYLPINTTRYARPVPDFAYPKFYHAMATVFPRRSFHLLDRFMGPVLDGLFTLVLYWTLLRVSGDTRTALWMTLIFIFTPAFSALISLGPRMSSFTPRGFSEIVCNLYWLAYLGYLEVPHVGWIGLAALCGAMTIWSSKFSLQALVFITFALCIFTLSVLPLFFLGVSFVLALLIARKMVWLSLRQQVDHLKWYCIQNMKGLMTISDRNAIRPICAALRAKDLRKLVNLLLVHNSYFIAVVRFPLALIGLYLVIHRMYTGVSGIPLGASEGLILAGFAIFLLSSLKWFLFIGEAERYLNHILIALLLYTADFVLPYAGWLCAWGAIYGLFDLCFAGYLQRKDQKLARSDRIMEVLQQQNGICNVLEVPFGISGGSRLLTETPHNWVYPVLWSDEDREVFNQFMARYPMIDLERLDEIIPAYSVHIVVVDCSKIEEDTRVAYETASNLVELSKIDHIIIYRTTEPMPPDETPL